MTSHPCNDITSTQWHRIHTMTSHSYNDIALIQWHCIHTMTSHSYNAIQQCNWYNIGPVKKLKSLLSSKEGRYKFVKKSLLEVRMSRKCIYWNLTNSIESQLLLWLSLYASCYRHQLIPWVHPTVYVSETKDNLNLVSILSMNIMCRNKSLC